MVARHESVVDRHGDCAAGFVKEDDGDEKAEGVVLEGLLDEAKSRRGQWREGDTGDRACFGTFLGRFGKVGGSCRTFGSVRRD